MNKPKETPNFLVIWPEVYEPIRKNKSREHILFINKYTYIESADVRTEFSFPVANRKNPAEPAYILLQNKAITEMRVDLLLHSEVLDSEEMKKRIPHLSVAEPVHYIPGLHQNDLERIIEKQKAPRFDTYATSETSPDIPTTRKSEKRVIQLGDGLCFFSAQEPDVPIYQGIIIMKKDDFFANPKMLSDQAKQADARAYIDYCIERIKSACAEKKN